MPTAGHEKIKHIIAIASGKGGVGKSTVAANLTMALNKMGYKVGLMDADIYGPSQPGLFGSDEHPSGKDGYIVPINKSGIKFISMGMMTSADGPTIMRAPMAVRAINQFLTGVLWGELDFLFIDMPPGTGDIQLTIAQQAKLSGVIIITTPQKMASQIAKKGLQMFETLNAPILGVVENMSGFICNHCNKVTAPFRKGGGRKLASDMNVPFMGELPLDPNIMMASDEGINIQAEYADSESAQYFIDLARIFLLNVETAQINALRTEPEKIEHDETMVWITWKDGSKTKIDTYTLRGQCPCAACVDEFTGQRIVRAQDIPLTIKANSIRPVGRYGAMVEFSDGHNKGIYRYSLLKKMSNEESDKAIEL